MTRRTLFARCVSAAAGCVLARMPLVGPVVAHVLKEEPSPRRTNYIESPWHLFVTYADALPTLIPVESSPS